MGAKLIWPKPRGPILRQLNAYTPDDKYERVALMFVDDSGISLIEVPNMHPTPETHCRIFTSAVRYRERLWPDRAFMGVMHTHLDAGDVTPSPGDLEQAASALITEWPWRAIYHPLTRLWTWYTHDAVRSFAIRSDLRRLRGKAR